MRHGLHAVTSEHDRERNYYRSVHVPALKMSARHQRGACICARRRVAARAGASGYACVALCSCEAYLRNRCTPRAYAGCLGCASAHACMAWYAMRPRPCCSSAIAATNTAPASPRPAARINRAKRRRAIAVATAPLGRSAAPMALAVSPDAGAGPAALPAMSPLTSSSCADVRRWCWSHCGATVAAHTSTSRRLTVVNKCTASSAAVWSPSSRKVRAISTNGTGSDADTWADIWKQLPCTRFNACDTGEAQIRTTAHRGRIGCQGGRMQQHRLPPVGYPLPRTSVKAASWSASRSPTHDAPRHLVAVRARDGGSRPGGGRTKWPSQHPAAARS